MACVASIPAWRSILRLGALWPSHTIGFAIQSNSKAPPMGGISRQTLSKPQARTHVSNPVQMILHRSCFAALAAALLAASTGAFVIKGTCGACV